LFFFVGLTACSSSSKMINSLRLESGYCDPPVVELYNGHIVFDSSDFSDFSLLKKYSERNLHVAQAAGVLGWMKTLQSRASEDQAEERQKILSRLFLISTEISSIAAELDCEGERADQVADFLSKNENHRVRILTVLSITVGAAAGIANASLHSHSAAESAAIAGGIIAAGLGLSALVSSKRLVYNHPRNLLEDIWNQKAESVVYPTPIWFMLSDPYFSNAGQSSIAFNLKQRWIRFEMQDENPRDRDRLERLYYGKGGKYNADELRARARMLNQVQASVKLMNQDLQGLIAKVLQ
jgi:hypothetical protein